MQTEWSYAHCQFGVGVRDVTPPVGIYARSWGAATHEIAEGIHRPMLASAAVLAPLDGATPELVLVALDLGWFPYLPDEDALRADVLQRIGKTEGSLLINLSHTHAGANVNSRLTGYPGAEHVSLPSGHPDVGPFCAGASATNSPSALQLLGRV